MSKQVKSEVESFARIRVVGVGGSGGNAVNHMVSSKVDGVDFIAVNTDAQDLHKSKAKKKIHIGRTLTRGLGTGMNSDIGKQAAEETREEIQDSIKSSDMVFITCGMGGGTGTGAAPVVAKVARELGALTVGVVTRPFSFEGQQRMRLAEAGIAELRKAVDAVIIIPNDKLLSIVTRDTGIKNAFAMCDDILKQAVEGISDLITKTGIINVDFADVRSVMSNAGSALMGIGVAMGDKRAELAAKAAINSPLLEVSIAGAKGVLFSIAGSEDLGMLEVQDAANVITEAIDPEAKVIFGAVTDETLKKGQVRVTVIATGFPEVQSRPNVFQPRVLPRKDDNTPLPSAKAEIKPEPKPEPKRIIDTAVADKKPMPEMKKPEPVKPAASAPKPA
ncbi:MAG TPA: cell division protein FtsZ, partial [Candidatus Paceibacterota bacterium]|nr:cell division protein FtsZ [Candidatus Paceibacterota bacterium]